MFIILKCVITYRTNKFNPQMNSDWSWWKNQDIKQSVLPFGSPYLSSLTNEGAQDECWASSVRWESAPFSGFLNLLNCAWEITTANWFLWMHIWRDGVWNVGTFNCASRGDRRKVGGLEKVEAGWNKEWAFTCIRNKRRKAKWCESLDFSS